MSMNESIKKLFQRFNQYTGHTVDVSCRSVLFSFLKARVGPLAVTKMLLNSILPDRLSKTSSAPGRIFNYHQPP